MKGRMGRHLRAAIFRGLSSWRVVRKEEAGELTSHPFIDFGANMTSESGRFGQNYVFER